MIKNSEKKWLYKTTTNEEVVNKFYNELKINPVLLQLLLQRGITNFEQAQDFFCPEIKDLHDPYLMKDMDKAVERISKAIEASEKIMILGDYDVDGTTATALSYKFLSRLTNNVESYIPDRYKEGYGISIDSIDYAAENSVGLIISLDCGIKAMDKVDYANEKGIDFIICDHHTPDETLPAAVAVLDPKRLDCTYPFKELSGAGVGFKLMTALAKKFEVDEKHLFESLDLLATSIAADIVPIVGENRILSHFGLDRINKNPSPGIEAMMETSGGKKKTYTISDIVFKIAPRINSAGRMSSGNKAVEILISDNLKEASKKMVEINQFNSDRRETDQDITKHAFELITEDEIYETQRTTVLYHPEWHKGVIGIVASRMIEKHYRPTIIFTGSEGILSGSARSVKDFNIYEAIEASSEYLIQFGGHKYAAGMTLKESDYPAFKAKFEAIVAERIQEEHLHPIVEIDSDLNLADISWSFFNTLKRFAPFGPENMNPVFCSKGIAIKSHRRLLGQNDRDHLKFTVFDPSNPKVEFDAIAFGMGDMSDELDFGVLIDLTYNLEENHWNGRESIQLLVKDLRLS